MSDCLISIFSVLAAWISSVSSMRLRSTCWRSRSTSSAGIVVAVGDRQPGEALVDVGLGDHVAVDDGRRLDDRRDGRAEYLRILRQSKRMRGVDCGVLGWSVLGQRRASGGQRDMPRRSTARVLNSVEKLLPRSDFPLKPQP